MSSEFGDFVSSFVLKIGTEFSRVRGDDFELASVKPLGNCHQSHLGQMVERLARPFATVRLAALFGDEGIEVVEIDFLLYATGNPTQQPSVQILGARRQLVSVAQGIDYLGDRGKCKHLLQLG